MTTAEEAVFFKLLDDYASTHYHCFVAEMFLNKSKTEYTLCFRPADLERDSPNWYAYRYLRIGVTEASDAAHATSLPDNTIQKLDQELRDLGQ